MTLLVGGSTVEFPHFKANKVTSEKTTAPSCSPTTGVEPLDGLSYSANPPVLRIGASRSILRRDGGRRVTDRTLLYADKWPKF